MCGIYKKVDRWNEVQGSKGLDISKGLSFFHS